MRLLEGLNKCLCSISSDSWDLVVIVTSIEHPILNYVVFWDDHFLIPFRLFRCSTVILFALTVCYSRLRLLFFLCSLKVIHNSVMHFSAVKLCKFVWHSRWCKFIEDTWSYFLGMNLLTGLASALHGRLLIKPELYMVCSHIACVFMLNAFFFAGYASNIYAASSCFILFCFPWLFLCFVGSPRC